MLISIFQDQRSSYHKASQSNCGGQIDQTLSDGSTHPLYLKVPYPTKEHQKPMLGLPPVFLEGNLKVTNSKKQRRQRRERTHVHTRGMSDQDLWHQLLLDGKGASLLSFPLPSTTKAETRLHNLRHMPPPISKGNLSSPCLFL